MIISFKILCFFSYFDISVFFETEARNVNQILIFQSLVIFQIEDFKL